MKLLEGKRGIIFGVAAVICMLSISEGASADGGAPTAGDVSPCGANRRPSVC